MTLSGKDYNRLYRLQDKFLSWWVTLGFPFYLTGGTALGRYYLNHRFSEDLDFFLNNDRQYPYYVGELKKILSGHFTVMNSQSLFADDFTRLFIAEEDIFLKIELINDVGYHAGRTLLYDYGKIDTPINILSNKLCAIVGRDEPKDLFDIYQISLNYAFNWQDIFSHAKQKAVINELDVEQRLISFPVEWLTEVNWLDSSPDLSKIRKAIRQISDDFLLGLPNSLGVDRIPIETAEPWRFL